MDISYSQSKGIAGTIPEAWRGVCPLGEGAARHNRIVIIGGGLSGLTAARRIVERAETLRQPVEVVVLEAKNRLGGSILTRRVDGFTIEGGPDSFITNKPGGVDLCRRLGLGDQLISPDPGAPATPSSSAKAGSRRSPRASS